MKQEVRKQVLNIRNSLAKEEIAKKSEQIIKTFLSSELYKNADKIFCYYNINSEVETYMLMKQILADGKRLFLPRCEVKTHQMEICPVEEFSDVSVGAYGIFEPTTKACKIVPDVTIVPIVAFDRNKNRIGYGGGYYDRFLASNRTVACGFAYSCQEVRHAKFEKTDVDLDLIITEKEVIQ